MNKETPVISAVQAAAKVNSGDAIIVGGFGMTGYPVHLVHALADSDVTELVYIGNNVGEAGLGGGRLIRNGQIARAIGSFFTSNREVVDAHMDGKIQCELLPQGTLSEAIRAAGAGIGGFYTPTGAGTVLAEGRETRKLNGTDMVFVEALPGDVALVRAWRADRCGNLQYRMTENNFNQAAATAATLVIAEVEEIVETGEIDPNQVHTPGCYIDFLVQANLTVEDLGTSASITGGARKTDDTRLLMAKAALAELNGGDVVNLGVGIPTLVADLITPEHGIVLHSENGMLGVGPAPESGGAMDFPVNAGKVPVTALDGTSYFDSAASFAMIRGRHIDVAILGALQVDESGNLANWAVPVTVVRCWRCNGSSAGAKRVIVTMTHCDRDENSKVVPSCTLPLTAMGVVTTLITDLGVFKIDSSGITLTQLMPDVTVAQITERTKAAFVVNL